MLNIRVNSREADLMKSEIIWIKIFRKYDKCIFEIFILPRIDIEWRFLHILNHHAINQRVFAVYEMFEKFILGIESIVLVTLAPSENSISADGSNIQILL